jgi:hypothetical protein
MNNQLVIEPKIVEGEFMLAGNEKSAANAALHLN